MKGWPWEDELTAEQTATGRGYLIEVRNGKSFCQRGEKKLLPNSSCGRELAAATVNLWRSSSNFSI